MEKTAMQQLKEKLEQEKTKINPWSEYSKGYERALQNTIDSIDSQMMAIEKGIIVDAFDLCSDKMGINGEQYYTQTFEK